MYRASAERSGAICRLSPPYASLTRRLIPTTVHGYSGCVLAGVDLGCVNRHIRLDGGLCVRSLDAGCCSMASHAHSHACLETIRGTFERACHARRTARIGSIRSDAWCVSRPERRGEGLGEGWEKPCVWWIEGDGSLVMVLIFFRSRVYAAPDRR